MSSRSSGAILALAAAMLLVISAITSAWWDGHPVSPTRTYTEVAHVGLHGAQRCMVDDASLETCKTAPTQGVFGPVGYVELGATGLLIVSLLGLAVMTLRRSEERKAFARMVFGGVIIADGLAIALLVIGPTDSAAIPIGYGLYVFFAGTTVGVVAALIARRPPAPLVLKSAPVFAAPPPQPGPTPPVDMALLMRDNQLQSSRPAAVQSPGGSLAGPAGPLGAPTPGPDGAQPLFGSAPQLKPLYEQQGGAAPVVQRPVLPTRAPTPMPRAAVSALGLGLPTPMPFAAPQPERSRPESKPPKPFTTTLSQQPPPPARAKPMTAPPPAKPITQPPPAKPQPPPPVQTPTPTPTPAARTAVPMPAKPAPARSDTELETGNFDAASTVQRDREPAPDPTDPSAERASSVGDSTDVSVQRISGQHSAQIYMNDVVDARADATNPSLGIEGMSTSEEQALAADEALQARDSRGDVAGDGTDELETLARERLSMRALGLDADRANIGKADTEPVLEVKPPPRTEPVKPKFEIPKIAPIKAEPAKPVEAEAEKPKQSYSTAPDSLPPPVENKRAQSMSGPSPACPQCESPMAWVEEHLRFYCKSCRMYF